MVVAAVIKLHSGTVVLSATVCDDSSLRQFVSGRRLLFEAMASHARELCSNMTVSAVQQQQQHSTT
jgi:hypothetical protein